MGRRAVRRQRVRVAPLFLLVGFRCTCAEDFTTKSETCLLQAFHELGPEAARHERATAHMTGA